MITFTYIAYSAQSQNILSLGFQTGSDSYLQTTYSTLSVPCHCCSELNSTLYVELQHNTTRMRCIYPLLYSFANDWHYTDNINIIGKPKSVYLTNTKEITSYQNHKGNEKY